MANRDKNNVDAGAAAEEFGRMVRTRRKARGWSQEVLAADAYGDETRKGHVSRIENGKIPNISRETVKTIARVLAIAPEDIPTALRWPEAIDDMHEKGAGYAEIKKDTTKLLDGMAKFEAMLAQMPEKTAKAQAQGVSEDALISLARRMHAEISDADQALKQLSRAVDIAVEVQADGHRRSNLGGFVEEVLRRVADLSARGDDEGARQEVEAALAEEDAAHAQKMLALLEAGLRQDELLLDASSAARRLVRIAGLRATPEGGLLPVLRDLQDKWYERGRDRGLNFDLEVSILLAQEAATRAQNRDQRGAAQNNLGNALWNLGSRESGTGRLEEAVSAYRLALEEYTRDRVPLDWATTQNNLGNALRNLGERESGTGRLEEAVSAYRLALEERTRDRVPLDWATTQYNLGNGLKLLGERVVGWATLAEARTAFDLSSEVFLKAYGDRYTGYFNEKTSAVDRLIAERRGGE